MQIRRYVGPSERALLARVKADLGPDAVILHTAFARRSGLFGLFQRRQIEIVAGGGFRIVRDFEGKAAPRATSPAAAAYGAPAAAVAAPLPPDALRSEIADLKRLMSETQDIVRTRGGIDGPQQVAEEYASLATHRISEALARRLVRQLKAKLPEEALSDRTRVRSAVRGLVKDMIRCKDGITLEPGRCVRVAFVGPTGVGKTTTIAKLISVYAHRGREQRLVFRWERRPWNQRGSQYPTMGKVSQGELQGGSVAREGRQSQPPRPGQSHSLCGGGSFCAVGYSHASGKGG